MHKNTTILIFKLKNYPISQFSRHIKCVIKKREIKLSLFYAKNKRIAYFSSVIFL